MLSLLLDGLEPLFEVRDYVIGVLDTDREADGVGFDPGGEEVLLVQLGVGGGGGVDHQGFHVGHVR